MENRQQEHIHKYWLYQPHSGEGILKHLKRQFSLKYCSLSTQHYEFKEASEGSTTRVLEVNMHQQSVADYVQMISWMGRQLGEHI